MLNAITIDTDTHTTQTQNRKERKEIFVSDEYIQYLDCGEGITVYAFVQTHQNMYSNYVYFFVYYRFYYPCF